MDINLSRSPDLSFILLTCLPTRRPADSGSDRLSSAITVAGQWRIFTALPVTKILFIIYESNIAFQNNYVNCLVI